MRRSRLSLSLAIRLPVTTAMVVAAALLAVFGLTAQVTRHHLATALDARIRASVDSFRAGPAGRVTDPAQLSTEAARWLSARELALLTAFARHRGSILSRAQLLELVWGLDSDPGSNVVEVYVAALRRKIGPAFVETVRGIGYRFVVPDPALAGGAP